jgi:hypothetical protein
MVLLKENTIKKSRVRKRCVWCGEWIEIGNSCIYRVYHFDGDFQQDRLHPECYDALYTYPDKYDLQDDGFDEGTFKRGEHLRRDE